MAHRWPKPGDVKTTDAPRLAEAFNQCLVCLMGDFRIEAPYRAWFAARDLERLDRVTLAALGTPRQAAALATLWRTLYSAPSAAEVAALDAVLTDMGVRWSWCAWALLSAAFPVTHTNSRLPPNEWRALGADVVMVEGATPGRQPTADGEGIRRHVRWWYRRKIKHPADTLAELEQEERDRTREQSTARRHSTILQGMQHAERLLEQWEVGEVRAAPEFF